jgi:hypothetical protein
MSEPSSNKGVLIAVIGAGATIVAALIGLASALLGPRGGDSPSCSQGKDPEKPRVAVVSPDTPSGRREEAAPVRPPEGPAAEPDKRPLLTRLFTRAKPIKPEAPPITLSWRKSKIPGHGMVVGLTNAAEKETLKNVVVSVKTKRERGGRSYRPGSIKPKKVVEVGWRELKNWKLIPGDRVTITADGYEKPVEVVVPRG